MKLAQVDIEDDANKCPTCQRPWPGKFMRRICRRCRQVVSNNHKYRLVPVGPLVFAFEHRDCDHPEQYEGSDDESKNEREGFAERL